VFRDGSGREAATGNLGTSSVASVNMNPCRLTLPPILRHKARGELIKFGMADGRDKKLNSRRVAPSLLSGASSWRLEQRGGGKPKAAGSAGSLGEALAEAVWQQIGNTIGDVNPMRLQCDSVQGES
jgi:hypothetical protein